MRKKGFNKKRFKYCRRLILPVKADYLQEPASSFRISISCATDKGMKRTNQDYYGVRTGSEIITFDQERASYEKEFHDVKDLVAAVADGVSMTSHPEDPEEDAQAIAVKYLLNNMYYQFRMGSQEKIIADELNEMVIEQADRFGGTLATTLSAIAMADNTVRIMYLGDSPVLHIHKGVLQMITPPKQSNYLEEYLGNTFAQGRNMVSSCTMPLEHGDIWILCSDGAVEALTLPDGSPDSALICDILKNNPDNPAQEIVRISGERLIPGEERKCTDNRTAIVIQIAEEENG